jgi:hypothetical protein
VFCDFVLFAFEWIYQAFPMLYLVVYCLVPTVNPLSHVFFFFRSREATGALHEFWSLSNIYVICFALCCLWTKYLEREREMEMKHKAEDV